jgi:hypothetical protein
MFQGFAVTARRRILQEEERKAGTGIEDVKAVEKSLS